MEQIIVYIIIFLPEAFLVVGILYFIQRFVFIKKSIKTFGEVTRIEERQHTRIGVSGAASISRVVFHPVIYFNDIQKNKHRCMVGMGGRFLSYNVGDKVPIIYTESKPAKCFLNRIYFVWASPVLFLSLGVISMIFKYKLFR